MDEIEVSSQMCMADRNRVVFRRFDLLAVSSMTLVLTDLYRVSMSFRWHAIRHGMMISFCPEEQSIRMWWSDSSIIHNEMERFPRNELFLQWISSRAFVLEATLTWWNLPQPTIHPIPTNASCFLFSSSPSILSNEICISRTRSSVLSA